MLNKSIAEKPQSKNTKNLIQEWLISLNAL